MTASPPGPGLLGLFSLLSCVGRCQEKKTAVFPLYAKEGLKEQKVCTAHSLVQGPWGFWRRAVSQCPLACNAASAGI